MNPQEKPKKIKEIEALWGRGFEIQLAPEHPNLISGLMAFKKNTPKYALDKDGMLIGINLWNMGLDDGK